MHVISNLPNVVLTNLSFLFSLCVGFRIMTRSQGHNQIYTIRCDDTRKVNIDAYFVQRDDTRESWPTSPTDLRQRGRRVQKQQEQLFYCWSEGELGKGDRGSSTTTILAYNPMASCPRKLLPCSNYCTCWSFAIIAYEILDVADKRPRYNILIADYIFFSNM